MFVALLIFVGIAFAIAHFLGRKRQIGFGWSFFFSIFLSFFGGLVVTMLSPKYYEPNPAPSNAKKMCGWAIIILFGLGTLGALFRTMGNDGDPKALNSLFVGVGFIGLGFYLIELSKGKNFNSEALTKVDN